MTATDKGRVEYLAGERSTLMKQEHRICVSPQNPVNEDVTTWYAQKQYNIAMCKPFRSFL